MDTASTTKIQGLSGVCVKRLEVLVSEAERAFRGQPKALWSDRTYLAPKDAVALRELLTELADADTS